MTKKNPYSTDLAMLRDYLKQGFNPYDFSDHLTGFFAFERGGDDPDWFNPDEPWESDFSQMSKKDLKDFEEYAIRQDVDEMSPSTAFFDFYKIVPRTTWLVHFSKNIDKILKNGLICGHEDMQTLGLTTRFSNVKNCRPGWNFGFEWDSKYANAAVRDRKYGDDFVMFQSAGVKAWHNGDEEDQIIFWGASIKNIVPVFKNSSGDFEVTLNTDSNKILVSGDFEKVTEWIYRNFKTYQKKIAYVRED